MQEIMQKSINQRQNPQDLFSNNKEFFQLNIDIDQILSLQEQKKRLRCPNKNQGHSVCISAECSKPGIMCIDLKCQCWTTHYKCHHVVVNRVLESIDNHHTKLPSIVKQSYKTIYDVINQMIDRLSQMRTKFQMEQKYFGLKDEQLKFIQCINDWKTDEINGKMISQLQKTFEADLKTQFASKQQIVKDFENKTKQFQKLMKNIENTYSKNRHQMKQLLSSFSDSQIVKGQSQILQLNKWISQEFDHKKTIKTKLLFRASEHNFSGVEFHKKCDGRPYTITIVKTQHDKIIGGFTPVKWQSNGGHPISDTVKKSFMFSLSLQEKYQCLNYDDSIFGYNNQGPSFGYGRDLRLGDNRNSNQSSYTYFGIGYNLKVNGQYKYKQNNQTYQILTGTQSKNHWFKINQYQVFQIQGIQ